MMFRKLFMSCAMVLVAVQVQAATITASTNSGQLGSFSLNFNDTDQDGLFSFSEMLRFSGMTLDLGFYRLNYNTLLGVPDLLGVSKKSGDSSGLSTTWVFSSGVGSTGALFDTQNWTYTISGLSVPSAVPLPAALPMLAAGAAVFGIAARLRKRRFAAL